MAVILTVAGCSVDGDAVASSGDESVDVATLDTGRYPTSPRPTFGTVTDSVEIFRIDAQRLAQYVVVPFEIDPDLTSTSMPTQAIMGSPGGLISDSANNVAVNKDRFLFGFSVAAGTPDSQLRQGNPRSLNALVLRYATPEDAKTAATQMAAATASDKKTTTGTLAGMPDTVTVAGSTGDNRQLMTFTYHQTFVIYEWFETNSAHADLLEPTVRKAIGLQTALVDQYPIRLNKFEREQRGIKNIDYPVQDQNKVLVYALPYTDAEIENKDSTILRSSVRAVYGPRGMAQTSDDPVTTFTTLTKVGSTANAVEKSVVYRANTPEGATTIVDKFRASGTSRGWKDMPAPPGLPNARCASSANSTNNVYQCYVKKGRYVGEVSSTDKKDVYQQAAAQYVILTKADQNAH
ncbi:hypothetical protein LK459_00135 [Gordonia otitidis]|uniref:DUF7373 family lipoprotein n=1 Tax=Gordonia otitidis TaxID=249058 RepID=UPI001D1380EA|nr:hypothetical protein [Gordonia otitidis]UEA59373.1 hypothetical protein LK459_00135 [Gordonia otitidis]